jgi:protein PhnA
MAKWTGKSKVRKNNVAEFGKEMVRRSKSTCELCMESGRSLSIYEVGKTEDDPEFDRCIHICDECKGTIKKLDKASENDLRFLSNAVWSETNTVKAAALHIISEVHGRYSWIDDLLDEVYIDEDLKEICDRMKH